jgi:hypothetical protein
MTPARPKWVNGTSIFRYPFPFPSVKSPPIDGGAPRAKGVLQIRGVPLFLTTANPISFAQTSPLRLTVILILLLPPPRRGPPQSPFNPLLPTTGNTLGPIHPPPPPYSQEPLAARQSPSRIVSKGTLIVCKATRPSLLVWRNSMLLVHREMPGVILSRCDRSPRLLARD